MRLRLLAIVLLAGTACGEDIAARAKLMGGWRLTEADGKNADTWTIEDKGAGVLRVSNSQGDGKVSQFECNTTGRECSMKDSGKSAKVSLWFNGDKLVELETRGREVLKRRFAIGEQADVLDVEVIPVVPEGKPEILHFRRLRQ